MQHAEDQAQSADATQIHAFSLTTGVRVIVEPVTSVRSGAIVWKVPLGSAHDPANMLGMAAVLEEMLLRGAADLDSRAQADAFDRLGASRSCKFGALRCTLASTFIAEHWQRVFELLADTVLRPALASDALEPARALAIAELEALADEPSDRAHIAAKARHWPGAFARSGYGTYEGLRAITHESVVNHWQRHAAAEGSILSIAGDVDPQAVRDCLEAALADWSADACELDSAGTPPRGYDHIADSSEQVQIVVVHDAPLESEQACWKYRLATQVLAGGMASRLFTEVREKRGLCYTVSAAYRNDPLRGWRSCYVGTSPDRAQESLDVLAAELDRLSTPAGAITAEEFDRARAGLRSRIVFSGESMLARAHALVSDVERLGRPRCLAEYIAEIDALTLDDVNRMLAEMPSSRATVQTLGPRALNVPGSLQ